MGLQSGYVGAGATRPFYAATGVTDGSGNVTFTFTTAFAATPKVTHAIETSLGDLFDARITAISTTAVTFNIRRSSVVVILGISVLQAPVAASGVTIHCMATSAGQTP